RAERDRRGRRPVRLRQVDAPPPRSRSRHALPRRDPRWGPARVRAASRGRAGLPRAAALSLAERRRQRRLRSRRAPRAARACARRDPTLAALRVALLEALHLARDSRLVTA